MGYLVGAVVLVGVIGLVNLIFTIGILRQVRANAVWHPEPMFALGPGSAVGEFTAMTTTGEPVSGDTLAGMVGFFTVGCGDCHELVPLFVERAREMERDKVLAVVGGGDEDTVRALAPVARVVVADLGGGPVARAFQNTWTPSLYLVDDDHRVVAVGTRMADLPIGTPARG